jgi:hypothetical protein
VPHTAGPMTTSFSEKHDPAEREQTRLPLAPPSEDPEKEAAEEAESENVIPRVQEPSRSEGDHEREQQQDAGDMTSSISMPPSTPGGGATGLVKKFGSLLIGHGSVRGSMANKRHSILGGMASPRPSTDVDRGSERVSIVVDKPHETGTAPTSPVDIPEPPATAPVGSSQASSAPPSASTHRRAATILDPLRGNKERHERRGSIGGASGGLMHGGTIGRHRRPSTGYSTAGQNASRPLADRIFGRTEEENAVPQETVEDGGHGSGEEEHHEHEEKEFKPVFMKGLFRSVFFFRVDEEVLN